MKDVGYKLTTAFHMIQTQGTRGIKYLHYQVKDLMPAIAFISNVHTWDCWYIVSDTLIT